MAFTRFSSTDPADLAALLNRLGDELDGGTSNSIAAGSFEMALASSGALYGRKDGVNTLQFDLNSGRMISGEVPWPRISGVPASLAYNSGLRDITSLAGDRVAGGNILLLRVGQLVTLELAGVIPSSRMSSGQTFLNVPTGFRRPERWDGYVPAGLSGGALVSRAAFMFAAGGFGIWSPETTDSFRLTLMWHTFDAPPAVTPGTPA